MAGLSPWGQAILAAVTGDGPTLCRLLKGDPTMRSQRVSSADVTFLAAEFALHVSSDRLLVEIALEREHEDCVVMLLAEPTVPPAVRRDNSYDRRSEPLLRRAISECGPAVLAEMVRDHVRDCLVVQGGALAGLPRLVLPAGERQTFLLPKELVDLEPAGQKAACGLLTEAADVLEQIERSVGWWNAALRIARGGGPGLLAGGLYPLYTSADGNCLLHACLLAAVGVRDRRVARTEHDPGASAPDDPHPRRLIRAAVHAALSSCAPLRALLEAHGVPLGGPDGLESRSVAHGRSLEAGHILVLAHIFGRPIVCFTSAELEYRSAVEMEPSAAAAAGMRVSGIFLPFLLEPQHCSSRDPLLVVYTRGHFSALTTTEADAGGAVWRALGLTPPNMAGAPVPLVDEQRVPLPVLFVPAGLDATTQLTRYCDTTSASMYVDGAPYALQIALQRCPPRDDGPDALPANRYYSADWRARLQQLGVHYTALPSIL